MAQYFNFKRLIEKYGTDFVAEVPSEGYYDEAGEWEKGEPERINLRGAIISHRESKIFRSEGALTGQDRALFMLEPLKFALQTAKIYYEGKLFGVNDTLNNAQFTGVWAYTLKYISAFKEARPEYDITETVEDLEDRLDGVLTHAEKMPEVNDLAENSKALEKRLDGVDDW